MADPYATITPARQSRIARARELRAEGLTHQAIAERMGLSRSVVAELLSDPDRKKARARRLSYGGRCRDCGATTDGSAGYGAAPPELCLRCAADAQHKNRYWTPERIIASFHAFHQHVGRRPTAIDAMVKSGAPSMEDRLSVARVSEIMSIPDDLKLPHPAIVKREFGSWSAGLAAAGFGPNATGGAAHRGTRGERVRQFVVFNKNGSGWLPRETVEARDSADAIQRVADSEGSYVAVPVRHWQEFTVAPKTVFAVVEDV